MSNYLAVFLAPRVLSWMAAVIMLAAALTWVFRGRLRRPRKAARPGEPIRSRSARPAFFFLFLTSLGLIVVVTLLREPWLGICWDCLGDWGLDRVLTGRVGTEVWLNVALFVPMVFFGTLLWRAPWRTAGAAMLLSLAIEIAQPLLGPGVNDLMDLIANGAGALIGAGGAAVLLLLGDTVRDRRLDLPRMTKVAISVGAGIAVLFAAPAWAATAQQTAAVERLEELFSGTTLADYQANRNDEWNTTLNQLRVELGRPTVIGLDTDDLARERFTWNIYFAVRCVFAEWTSDGFAAVPRDGADCTAPLGDVA